MRSFFSEFRSTIATIAIFFAILFLYTKLAGPISFSVNNVNTNKTDFFTAEGKGEVSEVPDSATVYLGITQQGSTVTDAQKRTNQVSQRLIESLKSHGISDKDIKTTNYSVNPNYGTNVILVPEGNQRITGYTVSQNFEVKVKNIDKVNEIVDLGTSVGANQVQGASFNFSDELLQKLQDKARKEAIDKAKKKAESLANLSGVRLGRVINVVENSEGGVFPMAASLEKNDNANQTDITPGQNTVSVNITLYYETF